jgi:thymidine kinase
VGKLYFYYAAMNAGKSTNLLQAGRVSSRIRGNDRDVTRCRRHFMDRTG